MHLSLNRPDLHYITGFNKSRHSLWEATYNEILLKEVHHFIMHRVRETLIFIKALTHSVDGHGPDIIGNEKFLKIHRIHVLYIKATHRHRLRFPQCHT